jgi:hypothetical protein
MPQHQDTLVSFDVPRDWEDRTIIAYRAPVQGDGRAPNLVMTRDRLADEEDFASYVERQVSELAKQLKGFRLLGSKDDQVGGRDAISLSFTTSSPDGVLVQRLTIVPIGRARIASFTLTAPESEIARVAALFERILTSVTFADEDDA